MLVLSDNASDIVDVSEVNLDVRSPDKHIKALSRTTFINNSNISKCLLP